MFVASLRLGEEASLTQSQTAEVDSVASRDHEVAGAPSPLRGEDEEATKADSAEIQTQEDEPAHSMAEGQFDESSANKVPFDDGEEAPFCTSKALTSFDVRELCCQDPGGYVGAEQSARPGREYPAP